MEVVDIKKILVPNLLIHIYLHCVRSSLWCATTLATLIYSTQCTHQICDFDGACLVCMSLVSFVPLVGEFIAQCFSQSDLPLKETKIIGMQPWQNDNQFTPIVICTLRPKSATSPNLQLGGVNQNLHLKLGQQTPSVGTLLAYLETTA